MAFTFSTEAFTKPLADFGRDSAQMILQTGQVIEQGLQKMMTNRQVQGLGQELGTINPESPEWAQQAVQLGSRYPLAMKSPAGQFMLGTQAKANAQWTAAQKATAQMDATTRRQVGMENMRQGNRVAMENMRQSGRRNEGVDLSGVQLPSNLAPQNPASAIGPTLSGEPLGSPMESAQPDETSQLMGIPATLGSASQAGPAPTNFSPADRALMTAKELQEKTKGTMNFKSGDVLRVAMQEDRQIQQEKRDTTRSEEAKALREERTAFEEEKIATTESNKAQTAAKRDASTALKAARDLVKQEEKALNDFDQETDPAGFAEQQRRIDAAGKKRRLAEERFDALLNGEDSEIIPVKNAFEAKALPPGTKYQTPDGRTFTR